MPLVSATRHVTPASWEYRMVRLAPTPARYPDMAKTPDGAVQPVVQVSTVPFAPTAHARVVVDVSKTTRLRSLTVGDVAGSQVAVPVQVPGQTRMRPPRPTATSPAVPDRATELRPVAAIPRSSALWGAREAASRTSDGPAVQLPTVDRTPEL